MNENEKLKNLKPANEREGAIFRSTLFGPQGKWPRPCIIISDTQINENFDRVFIACGGSYPHTLSVEVASKDAEEIIEGAEFDKNIHFKPFDIMTIKKEYLKILPSERGREGCIGILKELKLQEIRSKLKLTFEGGKGLAKELNFSSLPKKEPAFQILQQWEIVLVLYVDPRLKGPFEFFAVLSHDDFHKLHPLSGFIGSPIKITKQLNEELFTMKMDFMDDTHLMRIAPEEIRQVTGFYDDGRGLARIASLKRLYKYVPIKYRNRIKEILYNYLKL